MRENLKLTDIKWQFHHICKYNVAIEFEAQKYLLKKLKMINNIIPGILCANISHPYQHQIILLV
jgi:hypothetical protein